MKLKTKYNNKLGLTNRQLTKVSSSHATLKLS